MVSHLDIVAEEYAIVVVVVANSMFFIEECIVDSINVVNSAFMVVSMAHIEFVKVESEIEL